MASGHIRDFYELDERGKPAGYRNLDVLHQRVKPYRLRRRKADVETELPARTDRNHFVPLEPPAARHLRRARARSRQAHARRALASAQAAGAG